jgi:hypothetical protein
MVPAILERMKMAHLQGKSPTENTNMPNQRRTNDRTAIPQARSNESTRRRQSGEDAGRRLREMLQQEKRAKERESRRMRDEVGER